MDSVRFGDVVTSKSELPGDLDICTILAKNFLAHGRVLIDSFLHHHPGSRAFVLLVDEVEGYFDPKNEKFRLVLLEELGIDRLDELRFKYGVLELSTAAKPFFLEYLLNAHNPKKIVYLDPDILVMQRFDNLSELLKQYSIVLTPHLLEPIDDGRRPSELDILLAGTYNLGFVGLANTRVSRSFLSWWKRHLWDECMMKPHEGFHVDQKWVELALGLFDDVHVLRDPGYNVAYWNMGNRRLTVEGGKYFVNGKPLRFFHFSGLPLEDIGLISVHQNRFTLRDLSQYRPLFEKYKTLLLSEGYETVKQWRWAYDYFHNGAKITPEARTIYRESEELKARYPNPFSTGPASYFEWLKSRAGIRMHRRGLSLGMARFIANGAAKTRYLLQHIAEDGLVRFLRLVVIQLKRREIKITEPMHQSEYRQLRLSHLNFSSEDRSRG